MSHRDMGIDNRTEVRRWISEQGLKYVSLEFQEIIKFQEIIESERNRNQNVRW